jgi:hypothetical protein
MKVFFSPFKAPKIYFYTGKLKYGTPYFFPRNWVKYTQKEVLEQAKEKFDKSPENIKTDGYFKQLVNYYKSMQHAVDKKIGFDFVGLGWKTKWGDYRHEWNPIWSFVFFKWQIAIMFIPKHDSHYWESWLYYERDTDKTKSREERILECLENAPQIWSSGSGENKITTNYYTKILKPKYAKLVKI